MRASCTLGPPPPPSPCLRHRRRGEWLRGHRPPPEASPWSAPAGAGSAVAAATSVPPAAREWPPSRLRSALPHTNRPMELELTAQLVRGEPISFAQAIEGVFHPFRVGDAWGPPWSTTWFHVSCRVPDQCVGRRCYAV